MCLFFESKFRKLKINRRILVPLRYNYDKPEKPRRIEGTEKDTFSNKQSESFFIEKQNSDKTTANK